MTEQPARDTRCPSSKALRPALHYIVLATLPGFFAAVRQVVPRRFHHCPPFRAASSPGIPSNRVPLSSHASQESARNQLRGVESTRSQGWPCTVQRSAHGVGPRVDLQGTEADRFTTSTKNVDVSCDPGNASRTELPTPGACAQPCR